MRHNLKIEQLAAAIANGIELRPAGGLLIADICYGDEGPGSYTREMIEYSREDAEAAENLYLSWCHQNARNRRDRSGAW